MSDALHPSGLDETHAPDLRCWVASAHDPQSDFPIQNLPYGVFRARRSRGAWRVGVAIGDCVLDVAAAVEGGLLSGPGAEACRSPSLNPLLALGPAEWHGLRVGLSRMLREGGPDAPPDEARDALVQILDGARGTSSTGHVLVRGPKLTCRSEGSADGNRTAAWCRLPSGADLSCAMIRTRTVLRWDRYWKGPACR